ncbi:hypothetical protein ACRALDRAFT_1061051 [Sodiomyces alcalophilus JCM 7366]|uniref:uncharacterized protein n=1 Tax=Sodiomyces alcalophilus JCM 7366 TaxID=591952 RepID=UPI0039B6A2F4
MGIAPSTRLSLSGPQRAEDLRKLLVLVSTSCPLVPWMRVGRREWNCLETQVPGG